MRIGMSRRVVQVLALILFLLPPVVAGFGALGFWPAGSSDAVGTPADLPFFGTLSSSTVFGITLLDPFAALQTLAASKSLEFAFDLLIGALPVLVVYALIRGRVFCGWVCPVNFLLEGVDFLRKKLKLDVAELPVPRHTKLIVAAVVLVLSALHSDQP